MSTGAYVFFGYCAGVIVTAAVFVRWARWRWPDAPLGLNDAVMGLIVGVFWPLIVLFGGPLLCFAQFALWLERKMP